MILVDCNLLLYARVSSFTQHATARRWLDESLNSGAPVGLPWASLLAYLRIITNPRVFEAPESIPEAWETVREWLALDCVWIPEPTSRHSHFLEQCLLGQNAAANLMPDAHLAALALEHGLTLCSSDSDFARFPQVRWHNPLAASQ